MPLEAGGEPRELGKSYQGDFERFAALFNERPWFFATLPMYDLFIEDIGDLQDAAESKADSASYSTQYAFKWTRPFAGNVLDFALPSSVELGATRDITAAANRADIYQFKVRTANTAINCFGSHSRLHWFTWYQEDELYGALGVTVRLPRDKPDSYTLLLTGYLQTTFYIHEGNTLESALDGALQDADNWNGKAALVWRRTTGSSYLRTLIESFSRKSVPALTFTRSDSASFALASAKNAAGDAVLSHNASAAHRLEASLTQYLTLGASLGARWNYMPAAVSTLEVYGGISGKLAF
jgi:hypothetical protein